MLKNICLGSNLSKRKETAHIHLHFSGVNCFRSDLNQLFSLSVLNPVLSRPKPVACACVGVVASSFGHFHRLASPAKQIPFC